jgi:hypothetical protein
MSTFDCINDPALEAMPPIRHDSGLSDQYTVTRKTRHLPINYEDTGDKDSFPVTSLEDHPANASQQDAAIEQDGPGGVDPEHTPFAEIFQATLIGQDAPVQYEGLGDMSSCTAIDDLEDISILWDYTAGNLFNEVSMGLLQPPPQPSSQALAERFTAVNRVRETLLSFRSRLISKVNKWPPGSAFEQGSLHILGEILYELLPTPNERPLMSIAETYWHRDPDFRGYDIVEEFVVQQETWCKAYLGSVIKSPDSDPKRDLLSAFGRVVHGFRSDEQYSSQHRFWYIDIE